MKKLTLIIITFLIITLIICLTLPVMAGCKGTAPKQLDVYVWEGYLPDSVVAAFEQETGITLNIALISKNEVMETFLKGGGKADIVMPTQSALIRYYEPDLAQPIDLDRITNYEKVSRSLREKDWVKWDGNQMGSGEIYAIPYILGTSGLVVNTTKYTEKLDNIGWDVLFDADLKGRVSSRNNMESLTLILDLYGIPRENLIIDTNDTLNLIRDKAIELKHNVLKFYDSGAEILDLMKNEEVWVSLIWDGGGRQLSQFDAKFTYVLPKNGAQGWADSFVIPKLAENPEGAHLFIDFMLKPDIAAIITKQSGFNTTVEGSLDMTESIDKDLYRLTDKQLADLIYTPNLPKEVKSVITTFWEELSTVK